jgi:hypothetical protein
VRRVRLTLLVLVVVLLAGGAGGGYYWLHANGRVIFATQQSLFSAPMPQGREFAIGYFIRNASGATITMRDVGFPHGLPPHVSLRHSAIALKAGIFGQATWPPVLMSGQPGAGMHPLAGFHLGPNVAATIILGFVIDGPGAYFLNPVQINAGYPFLAFTLPASVTNTEGREVCIKISRRACRAGSLNYQP